VSFFPDEFTPNSTTLIRFPRGRGSQLDDRPLDAKPDQLPVAVAAFEHFVRAPGCRIR